MASPACRLKLLMAFTSELIWSMSVWTGTVGF